MCVQRVFDHVKPPKNAWILSFIFIFFKNPNEINRGLRLSGLGPNNVKCSHFFILIKKICFAHEIPFGR